MLELLFPVLVGLLLLLPALLIASVLRRQHPRLWRITLIRSLIWALPALGLICLGLGQWAPRLGYDPTQTPLAALIVLSFFTQLVLVLALPVSWALLRASTRNRRRPPSAQNEVPAETPQPAPQQPADPSRRRFLQAAGAAVPLLSAGTTAAAIAGTINGARVYRKPMIFPDLPAHLQGLRILHLSDLHLGTFMTLPQLASTLDRAREHEPHLVVVTGDIADNLNLLPAAMVMIGELAPPLGVFSCLGNHEYHAGVDNARNILAGTPGTLLLNFGLPLRWNGGDLFIAGIDNPLGRPAGQDERAYLRDALEVSMQRARPWYFTILLSHRPWVFDFAAPRGVQLTLAGHTHGGQVGFAGRSLLELSPATRYPWGRYRIGKRQLYTSAGAGQWIPFRLGCPAEAPVLELQMEEAGPEALA